MGLSKGSQIGGNARIITRDRGFLKGYLQDFFYVPADLACNLLVSVFDFRTLLEEKLGGQPELACAPRQLYLHT